MDPRTSGRSRPWRSIAIAVGTVVRLLWAPTLAAAGVVGLLKGLGLTSMSIGQWLIATPSIYLAWLLLLLALFCLETTVLRPFIVKPRRVVISDDHLPAFGVAMICLLYARMALLKSLPGMLLLRALPVFNRFYLRAYATRVHMGARVIAPVDILDPDITFIGRDVVLGETCRIVAHSAARLPDGRVALHFAPVRIRRAATIGGGTQIEMGVTIGRRSVVEPCSHVTPFTRIPADEVWGGSPAVFRRKRTENTTPLDREGAGATGSHRVDEILPIIARALGLPRDAVNARTDSANCDAWDSLGLVAIAASLHDRYGVVLPPDELFRLNSVSDLLHALDRSPHAPDNQSPASALPSDPELLPLLDPTRVTAALARQHGPMDTPGVKLQICVAATFVAEPLGSTLKLWCRAFGVGADVLFAGYNQVPATLLSPESLLHRNHDGLNVVLIRPEDLAGEKGDSAKWAIDTLLEAIEKFTTGNMRPLWVSDLPPVISPGFTVDDPDWDTIRMHWRERLHQLPGVEILDFSRIITEIGTVSSNDEAMAQAASAPYSAVVYQRLGIAISRCARQLRLPSKKVVAVDGDGTLWRGVVGEDGPTGLEISDGFRRFQQRICALKDRGVLLALISRNEPNDIRAAFDAHPTMPLKHEDFAVTRINWRPKSENLRDVAHELNVGLDAIVFLDDNPAEQLEVEAHSPAVTVVPLTENHAGHASRLERLWCFDASVVTEEDRARTDYVRQEAQRTESASTTNDFQAYLKSLEVGVKMRPAVRSDWPRVAQLTQRTNQFNLSLRRRTLAEIQRMAAAHSIWVVSAHDRFGDYGLVGVGILSSMEQPADIAMLDTLLLSCRALGRGVEESFLHGLTIVATQSGATQLCAPFKEGPRNSPVRTFLTDQGWQMNGDGVLKMDLAQSTGVPGHVDFVLDQAPLTNQHDVPAR